MYIVLLISAIFTQALAAPISLPRQALAIKTIRDSEIYKTLPRDAKALAEATISSLGNIDKTGKFLVTEDPITGNIPPYRRMITDIQPVNYVDGGRCTGIT